MYQGMGISGLGCFKLGSLRIRVFKGYGVLGLGCFRFMAFKG